jgi:hypothetical protein
MLLRLAALLLGLLELFRPRRVVDWWLDLAVQGEATPRSWVYTAARVEGLVLVWWALRRARASE